jgi:hypothetical protein
LAIYRLPQEERSIFWEVIAPVILSKNHCLIYSPRNIPEDGNCSVCRGHPYIQQVVYLLLLFPFKMRQHLVVGGSVDELEGTWKETVVAQFKAISPHSLGGKGKVVPVLK